MSSLGLRIYKIGINGRCYVASIKGREGSQIQIQIQIQFY